jgi:Phage capsid protein
VGKVQSQAYAASTAGFYMAYWAKSGVHLGKWRDIQAKIDLRIDKRYATQVYVEGMFGGTRLEEKKVVLIDTTET